MCKEFFFFFLLEKESKQTTHTGNGDKGIMTCIIIMATVLIIILRSIVIYVVRTLPSLMLFGILGRRMLFATILNKTMDL